VFDILSAFVAMMKESADEITRTARNRRARERREAKKHTGAVYSSPAGSHRHKCYECGTIWEHSDACHGDRSAHDCPNPECDGHDGYHYRGVKPPDYRLGKGGKYRKVRKK
jgi:hypothetical protein